MDTRRSYAGPTEPATSHPAASLLHRAAVHRSPAHDAPTTVNDVLRSSHRLLDPAGRRDVEPRSHDFTCVPLQAKLQVSRPGDRHEQEADRVAGQVVEGSSQASRVAGGSVRPVAAPPIVHDVLRSHGQPLDSETREFMEPRFGCDFRQVRVHTSGQAEKSARAVGARAFTVGRDAVFNTSQYTPATQAGKRLIAHELAHVVQQAIRPAGVTAGMPAREAGRNTADEGPSFGASLPAPAPAPSSK